MLLASTGVLPVGFFFFISVFLLGCAVVFPASRNSNLLVFALIAGVAACRFLVAVPTISPSSINREGEPLVGTQCRVVGDVAGAPEFHPYASGSRGAWAFPLRLEGVGYSNQWVTCRGEIDVRFSGTRSRALLRQGQRVVVAGMLDRNLFPGANTLRLDAAQGQDLAILSPASRFSLLGWGRAWREAAAARLEVDIEKLPLQQAVLKALVLGYRKEMPQETIAKFRRTGSVHIFAISGLHVGIVGLLLMLVLKTIGIPRDWLGIWLIPMLLVYVVSTGMKSSALRALAMAAVFLLAPRFRRKPDIPSSVALAAILLLLASPFELMSAGFVFSFTVVIFIVMVYSKVPKRWLQGHWLWSYSKSLAITSAAASLASVPVAALYFGTFAPVAILGNLVVVPLTFCIVLSGWLSILLPVASGIFNHAAVVFVNLLLMSVDALDRIPGSCWNVHPPPLIAVFLWYASWVYFFAHATRNRQRWAAAACAACAILLAFL
jgi:ComEC/Rec2-related protein